MSKASPIIENFNSGEFSPLLAGRIGFEKYPNGATICENFIPTIQGPNKRRAGTRFTGETKANGRVLFMPFEYSVEQAYVMEFGDLYVRFWTWDAVTKVRGLLSVGGVPVEVVTPYAAADLYSADGTPSLKFTQSGDFIYLAHAKYQPRILKRLTATSFDLALYEPLGGPYESLNETAVTVNASAETGSVTLTASAALFTAGMVGSLFYIESPDVSSVPPWEVGKTITAGARRRSDGKTYEALNAATTGTNRPVHNEGALFDGDAGVQWAYRDAGYGYVRITAVASGTVATATVIDRLPSDTAGTGKATRRWAQGSWSNELGWPSCVALFNDRLWWSRKQNLWGSVAADYNDFNPKTFGTVSADMSITVRMASGKINDIQWLTPDRDLVAGTAGGEFAIGQLTSNEPLGPANVRARLLSNYGSRSIPPIKNGESLLFIQRAGLKARETFYDFTSDGYKSTDTTVLSEHITETGVTQMTFAQEPDQVIWAVRTDGKLIGFTWNNEQSVRGWHRHPIGGDGFVETLAVIPAAEGDRSELWLVVRRTINGETKRYVEYMERPFRVGDAQASQFYVDAGLTYTGAATNTVTGLEHLEGMTVSVLANGAPEPDTEVVDGKITMKVRASTVQVGLPCVARYRSMRIEAGGTDGTAQGKIKRITKIVLRLLYAGGGKFGPLREVGDMDGLEFRVRADPMTQAVPLFTGDIEKQWPAGYDRDGYVGFLVDQPVAATLVALMPRISTENG